MTGWRLDEYGNPTADIMCPHGHAVEQLNSLDYGLAYDDPRQTKLSQRDLAAWMQENRAVLRDYCMAHG